MTESNNSYNNTGNAEKSEIYKLPELLAPAGSIEALKAAVENGADAVYLGGKLFNARQYAGNFENEELEKAIDFSHVRGVKIYLTLNTLISDTEMEEALVFAGQAYNMGVDGIIVQDLGLARLIREKIPGLDLHASTQMTIYNSEGVKFLSEIGFKRVVLAREVTLEEVNEITSFCTDNYNTEIEIFVHGALCISYSGQCLMSSIIGGRSGNRGRCAQPCRLPYQLIMKNKGYDEYERDSRDYNFEAYGSKSYIMSPKDICTIRDLEAIIKAGVKSLKIEGRMKSPEYVATVTGIYRKYLDMALENIDTGSSRVVQYSENINELSSNITTTNKTNIDKAKINKTEINKSSVTEEDMKKLHQIFNRGGFSKGYLYGKTGADMMSFEKPKNWGVYIGTVMSYDSRAKLVKVKLEDNLAIGDGIEIWSRSEGESPGTVVSEIIRNKANIKEAVAGDIVSIGRVSGRINQGNKVYKTSSKKLIEEARESWTHSPGRQVTISGELYIKQGEVPILKVKDNDGNEAIVKGGFIAEKAINVGLTEERAREQINKTGGTPFKFGQLSVHLDENVALPIKELNNLRRKALEELETKRIAMFKYKGAPVNIDDLQGNNIYNRQDTEDSKSLLTREKQLKISLLFYNIDDYGLDKLIKINQSNGLNIDRIYLPFSFFLKYMSKNMIGTPEGRLLENIIRSNKSSKQNESNERNESSEYRKTEFFVWLPSITRGNYDSLMKRNLPEIIELGVDGILTGNVGTLEYVRHISSDVKLACDYSYNIFNSYTAETIYGSGADSLTLSYELTLEQIENISRVLENKGIKKDKEIVVYGRIPLMITEYCPVGAINDKSFTDRSSSSGLNDDGILNKGTTCATCVSKSCTKGAYFLQDRMKERFPIYNDRIDCRTTIFNSKVLFMADNMDQISRAGADILRLNIWDESIDEVVELIKMHRDLLKGNYDYELKKYKNDINAIRDKGFTRGHYYRGV